MDLPMSGTQMEAWDVVRRINAAWREGHPERLSELFHDRIAIVGVDGRRYGEGKVACADSYRSFCEHATVTHYQESDPAVEIYDTVAIVNYGFEIEYEIEGKSSRESGRDVFVLEKIDGRWLAVWRQFSAQPS